MNEIWKPHTTVASIIERDKKFLIVEENINGKIVYNQPAGHLDPNESLIDAAIRETREETAWNFNPRYISGIYRWEQVEKNRCYIRVAFVGDCDDHKMNQPLDDGIIQAVWLDRKTLASQPNKLRSPMVLKCIDDYLSGKQYPLHLLTDVK